MGFVQDQLRKTSVESAVATDAINQNKGVLLENAAITTANAFSSVKKPLIALVVSDEEQKNRVAILKKMGFTNGEQVAYFGAEVDANPQLKTFFAGFEKDFANTKKYDAVLAKMGKQILADGQKIGFDADAAKGIGTGIIDKLSSDLKGKGPEITKQLREKPESFAAKIDGYATGKVGLAEFIADAAIVAPAPAAAASAGTNNPAQAQAPAGKKPAVVAAPAPTAAPAAPAPVAAAAEPVVAAPTEPTSAPASTGTASTATTSTEQSAEEAFAEGLLSSLATASDSDIKAKLGPAEAKIIAAGLASKAISVGVNPATVNGFKEKIESKDGQLAQAIAKNLQNNPDFVRSMAKMALDKTPINPIMKPTILQEMNRMMEKPGDLASDAYIKGLQDQMKKGKALEDQMGQYMGYLKSGMNNIMMMMSGFTGQHSVISMGVGGGILPNFLINLHNMGRNQDEARAFANYSPSEMTALVKPGKNGTFFQTVMKKDAQGNEVETKVPYGQITVRTADGKDVDIIPSVGALMAKQEKGSLDANGNFVPGRIKVPVVTSIDQYGVSSGIKNIYMTETEFAKYKAQADALGAERGGTYSQLAFQNYTAQDLADAQKTAFKVNVANVDRTTGEVFHVTAQPNLLRPTAPAAEPVRQVAGTNPANAANERDFTMQG